MTLRHDLAAAHFAVHPDSGLLQPADSGSIEVGEDGRIKFVPGNGNVRALRVDPAQKEKLIAQFVELAAAKPVAPQQRFRPVNANAPPAAKKQN